MNNLDTIINQCLTLLKQSKVSAIKKMRMEMQLTKLRMQRQPICVILDEENIGGVVSELVTIYRKNNEEESLTDLITEIDRFLQSVADKPLSGTVHSGKRLFGAVDVGMDTNLIVAPESSDENHETLT